MDFHDKEAFDRLVALTEDNNRLLHKLVRGARLARIARITYWLIIFGISIGAYYYFEPYINQMTDVFGGLLESINSFKELVGSVNG
jgi:hypothetical protein